MTFGIGLQRVARRSNRGIKAYGGERILPCFARARAHVCWRALKIGQVIRVRCLLFKQGQTKGDYHGYVCKDKADVFPRDAAGECDCT